MRELATVILAAGKGTRMKSPRPKVLYELAGKTMIRRVVETAAVTGSSRIVVVVGYQREEVIASLDKVPGLEFAEQLEQLGTGHAVMMTSEKLVDFDGDVLILCGDVPLTRPKTMHNFFAKHRESNAQCTVLTAVLDDPARYGRIIRDEHGEVERIVEYRDADEDQRRIREINTGIWCFDARTLFSALRRIDTDNDQNEYYLTDTLEIIRRDGGKIGAVILDDMIEAAGVNSQQQLAELEQALYHRVRQHWMDNGVTICNPCSVLIGDDVHIGAGSIIEAQCLLQGSTRVGEGARIGAQSLLMDADIGDGAWLKGGNTVVNASVGRKTVLEYRMTEIEPAGGNVE